MTLDADDALVLFAIRRSPMGVSVEELAEMFGADADAIARRLAALVEAGFVQAMTMQ